MPNQHTVGDPVAHFWSRVDKSGGPDACWEWTGARTRRAYGMSSWQGKIHWAHRIAYLLAVGPVPSGLFVCHRCDNPPCVNPAHLWAGDAAANNADMAAKGRSRHPRGDQNGARLHPERLPRGESHGRAKLTEALVVKVRERAAAGEPCRRIASDLNVDPSTIECVVNRTRWKHVP